MGLQKHILSSDQHHHDPLALLDQRAAPDIVAPLALKDAVSKKEKLFFAVLPGDKLVYGLSANSDALGPSNNLGLLF